MRGSVVASLLFPTSAATGLLLLPRVPYQARQIIVASSLALYLGQQSLARAPTPPLFRESILI